MAGRANERRDGRTERWLQHRQERREELIDAAFQALARYGANASMDDIAAVAGAAKPKLYRYFTDKAGLFAAIAQRTADILWERLLPTLNPEDPPQVVVRRALEAFLNVVDEYPAVFRFLTSGQFVERSWDADPVVRHATFIAKAVAAVLAERLETAGIDNVDMSETEPWAHGIVGAVAASTKWWIRHPAKDKEGFANYLTTLVWGIVEAMLRSHGVAAGADQPVRLDSFLESWQADGGF